MLFYRSISDPKYGLLCYRMEDGLIYSLPINRFRPVDPEANGWKLTKSEVIHGNS